MPGYPAQPVPGYPAQPVPGYSGQSPHGYPPPGTPPPAPPPAGTPKSGGKGCLIAVIVAVVLLVLCGGVAVAGVLLLGNSDDSSSSETSSPSLSPSNDMGKGGNSGGIKVRMEARADSGTIAILSWVSGDQKGAESNMASPWIKEIGVSSGDLVSILITGRGYVSCKIISGSEVRAEQRSTDGTVRCEALVK
ncbi:hypothetical protein ACWDV4_09880 [Micromonospora sp. NPDC003197]